MLGAACGPMRFLLGVVILAMGVSGLAAIAEARHGRHHGHYHSRHYLREVDRNAHAAPEPAPRTSNYARQRNGAGGFADGIRRMIGACTDQMAEMKGMPFDAVSRTIRAGETSATRWSRSAATASTAADRVVVNLVTACPAEGRLTPLGRLDAKQRQLQSVRQGIDAIRPALAAFENSLNEAQRAQLTAAVFLN